MTKNTPEKQEILNKIKEIYKGKGKCIQKRLKEFKKIYNNGNNKEIFAELAFCLLTPQSKAKSCWNGIENLLQKEHLFEGNEEQILGELNKVRFKFKKAKYIIRAREELSGNIKSKIDEFKDSYDTREWLVQNVKGMGYKEASHFLRNIGLGEKLAILDRHILKNLKLLGVIKEIPSSLSKKEYLMIEKKLTEFAKKVNIRMDYLDLILWCKETGEIFK
ncbi:MAG: N-glycosylase/DNA lyase [bacterium]|nr:N-glycosylase/DNA lyase [bacterium]